MQWCLSKLVRVSWSADMGKMAIVSSYSKCTLLDIGLCTPNNHCKQYMFVSRSRIFHWRAAKFKPLLWACGPCEQRGIFIVPHLLSYKASIFVVSIQWQSQFSHHHDKQRGVLSTGDKEINNLNKYHARQEIWKKYKIVLELTIIFFGVILH